MSGASSRVSTADTPVHQRPTKLKLSEKGLRKKIEQMAQQQYDLHLQLLEDRQHRRQMRDIRREDGEHDVSDDSEDDEIDRYEGLSDNEKWTRMINEASELIMAEEVRRLLVKEKKRHNILQNKAIRQGKVAVFEADQVRQSLKNSLLQQDVYQKRLVILEPLVCITTTLAMCLIGYKETLRLLTRDDMRLQYDKASLGQCKMSLEVAFAEHEAPVQVKVEMIWRFAVVMHDFLHGSCSRERAKYIALAQFAHVLLRDQVRLERDRRRYVRDFGTDEQVALLAKKAKWELDYPELYYEMAAYLNSAEMETDEQDSIELRLQMENANCVTTMSTLRERVYKVAVPPPVTAPE